MSNEQPPTGVVRRRRRLSDAETAQRMLDAAVATVEHTGLTVSLDHLSFEDVIRDAGVARSAVYRRWPYKDLFLSDLLKELARRAPAAAGADGQIGEAAVRRLARERLDQLATAQGRRELCGELLRQGALRDFAAMRASTQWRTYIALHATFLGLTDDDLRREVRSALAAAEHDLNDRIARSYRELTDLLGMRLRPDLHTTFEELATTLNATMRGFVLTSLARPDLAETRRRPGAFGATDEVEWSQPALGVAATALSFLEPDPDITWDAARLARIRETL
ncbi:hypothetical protein [Streptomyces catenulae]|uniref:HTH tetR-type domain-containing protein n=1 Tax=Streptomyces catenulae TaxID=66875 RepID=A0ABV2Z264_9ACTN|nr:hypothetical protein [Streptomyces catenulae]